MKTRITCFLLLLGLLPASARAAPDQTDAAVTAALMHFIDALEAGDAQTIKNLINIFESSAQEQARNNFVELAVAQKSLEKAAIAKFGEEGKRFRCGFDLIVNAADRKLLASAPVHWDDPRNAHIEIPGEITLMRLRLNPEGVWQVVLEHIEYAEDPDRAYPPWPSPQPAQVRQAQLAAIKQTQTIAIIDAFKQTKMRIENGEFASAAAAQSELLSNLSAATVEAAKARAALPPLRMKDR